MDRCPRGIDDPCEQKGRTARHLRIRSSPQQQLFPRQRTGRRGGHHEEEILRVEVHNLRHRGWAQDRAESLDRFRLTNNTRPLTAPIIFHTQFSQRLFHYPAAPGNSGPFNQQDDVGDTAAQFTDGDLLRTLHQGPSRKVFSNVIGGE